MSVGMFMKVDGVAGESADSQHQGWTDIQSFAWGANQPGAMASGSGGNAGRANFNDLMVVAYMDRGAAAMIKRCANGKHLAKVELSVCKMGGSQLEYNRVTLEEVLVTSAKIAGIDRGDAAGRLSMNYRFQAARVKNQYWEQSNNGGKGAEVTVAWNVKENVEM